MKLQLQQLTPGTVALVGYYSSGLGAKLLTSPKRPFFLTCS